MKDVPADLRGYKFIVSEAPTVKLVTDKATGQEKVSTIYGTEDPKYVIRLFSKPVEAGPTGVRGKGEEIKVTLLSEPGDEIDEGVYVDLIGPTVSPYAMTDANNKLTGSGLSYTARAVSPKTS